LLLILVTKNVKADFIIVGQGLAGTLLGYELIGAGKSVVFIDGPDYEKASEVAAGLVNPVVFKRMTKSWRVDELYPQMLETYGGLESMLGAKIYFPLRIRKVFAAGEQALWERRYFENDLENYITLRPDHAEHPLLEMPYGSGWVEKGGRTDLKKLLVLFKAWLNKNRMLIIETFDYKALEIQSAGICYKGIRAGKIVFCEGHRANCNPFFSHVIYKPVKGEILDLHVEDYRSADILNKNFFLMPSGKDSYRLGATYDHEYLDELPTEAARQELCDKLSQVLKNSYTVTGHQAGIRPVTHDRRPVIGLHPQYPDVGIMNGLGAKGCLTGPFTARIFAALLSGEGPAVPREMSLSRYYPDEK